MNGLRGVGMGCLIFLAAVGALAIFLFVTCVAVVTVGSR
jgi:hypothetical protein